MNTLKEIPTTTAKMREAIILASAWWMLNNDTTREGAMKSDIRFAIEWLTFNNDVYSGIDWDDRGLVGKAFERAFTQLVDEGIIIQHPNEPNGIEWVFPFALFPNVWRVR